jgi:hypothetical protein
VCGLLQETLAERRDLRAREKEALGRGEMPETLNKWKVRASSVWGKR